MSRVKGSPKTGGRKKGTKNKMSRDIKAAVLESWENLEGGPAEYLMKVAEEDPKAYLTLIGKVLPTQITTDEDGEGFTIKVITGVPSE
jgi:hypothetical protein